MLLETPTSPLTAVHTISLGWTPVAPLSEEESPALPGWSPSLALFLLLPNPQCEETPSLPQPFSGEAGWCQRSALCILAPLPTPEVTIPEQKLSKGKGAKTGSKEKRSILMESEVGWEKWGGEHVPGVQAPSPSWDGVSSPVLWQQPLHLALCPRSGLLPIPAWACRGNRAQCPQPSIRSPIFDPCLHSVCSPNAICSSPAHSQLLAQLQRGQSPLALPAALRGAGCFPGRGTALTLCTAT